MVERIAHNDKVIGSNPVKLNSKLLISITQNFKSFFLTLVIHLCWSNFNFNDLSEINESRL